VTQNENGRATQARPTFSDLTTAIVRRQAHTDYHGDAPYVARTAAYVQAGVALSTDRLDADAPHIAQR
jgi:hypothetical protein